MAGQSAVRTALRLGFSAYRISRFSPFVISEIKFLVQTVGAQEKKLSFHGCFLVLHPAMYLMVDRGLALTRYNDVFQNLCGPVVSVTLCIVFRYTMHNM